MIDRRELLEKAREKNLSLGMIEKDYVLGWLLFGFSTLEMVFKGGTALSKIFFPETWRLSEDLDFSYDNGKLEDIDVEEAIKIVERESGLKFRLKSRYQNIGYLQLKIQYQAILGKNWVKIDITREKVLDNPLVEMVKKSYSDYPEFSVKVMSIEEIFAEKLRALIERNKSRDYYDIWRMLELKVDNEKLRKLFLMKCRVKQIEFKNLDQLLPRNIEETLQPYWERELSRLVFPIPDLKTVIYELKKGLEFLQQE